MRSNKQTAQQIWRAIEKVSPIMRRAKGLFTLGLEGKQWLACALVCTMLLPVFSLPVSASVGLAAGNGDAGRFEPVNEQLPIWEQVGRSLNAKIEAWRTPYRAENVFYDENDDKKKGGKGKKVSSQTEKSEEGSAIADGSNPIAPTIEAKNEAAAAKTSTTEGATVAEKTEKQTAVAETEIANKPANPAANTTVASALMNEPFPIEEREWLFTPENNLGAPPGQTEPSAMTEAAAARTRERAGIGNFGFDIPVMNLSGRGMNASVGITYNSRMWTKSIDSGGANHFTFDVENSWLAAGFNLSFGYLEMDYPSGQSPIPRILTDPNGTRHQLFSVGSGRYETADGTFISVRDFVATYPDGTKIRYYTDAAAGYTRKHFPTSITDRHGNRIYTVYESDMSGRLNYIVDTLNRYIHFHYDATPEKKLVAVTVPSLNAAPNSATSDATLDRQTIRFYYETLNLQYQNRFDGVMTVPNGGQIQVLKYVYFPGTKTGYRYDYSTYYGMIYKITKLHGMTASTTSLTETGTISNEGQWGAWTKYNYPGTDTELPSPTLTDMPKYDKRFDEWQGRTGGGSAPTTNFNVTEDGANAKRTTTITSPDGTVSETISKYTPPGDPRPWDDGLIQETIIKTGGGTVMSKNMLSWEPGQTEAGGRQSPRVKQVDATNEANQTKAAVYEYSDLSGNPCSYNNVCQVKEYDFAPAGQLGTLLRNTVTTYETGANYINNRLLSLVKSVKTIVGGQTVSRVEYSYDTTALTTYSNITNFDPKYNPATGGPTTHCEEGCEGITRQDCCWTIPGWDTQTGFRGNITQVKTWADAAVESDPLAETTVLKYDIAGNVVEATLNCCQLREWIYTNVNQYAYPVEIKNGLNGEMTSSAVYDYNTGLMTSSTDENNQITSYQYETDTLRQKKTIYPNGGYVETQYSDKLITDPTQLVPGFVKQTTTLEATKFATSYGYFDGRGLGLRTATQTPDGWSVSAMEYDNLGRPKKSYNPFYATEPNGAIPTGTKFTEVINYDTLGRATQVKLQDLTSVYSYPNEAAVTFTDADAQTRIGTTSRVKDQADKERRQIVDALGRVIRVDEPTTAGLGSVTTPTQPTHYYYDGNDNLSKVVQIEGITRQERKFKYDSLSRLTHEKQVEATATLNDLGVYGTPDPTKWTKVLKYDAFGRLTEGTDARGVKTTFAEYDPLNRLKRITFSDNTPTITYTYDQARTGFFNHGALTRVETAAGDAVLRPDTPVTATEFDYDKMGRVVNHRQTIGTQTYALEYGYNLAGQLTSEKYPSGKVVSMAYDANGRLASIADTSRTYLSGLQFQGKGNALSSMTLGNGTIQTFGYNDRLQMNQQELKRGTEVLQKYDYGYGQIDASGNLDLTKNNGQLARIESHIGAAKQWTQKFSYDAIGRLSEAAEYRGDNANLSYKQKFDFDRFGNLYRKVSSNPTTGQATPIAFPAIEDADISKSTNRFTSGTNYDDAGNVIQDTKFRNQNFWYDANGRMYRTSVINQPNQSNAVYDSAGQRVATQVDGVWTFFIYDVGGKKVAEYGGLQATDEGGVKYVLQDHQGSSRAILSNSGFVNARMDYTAFGEEIQSNIGQRTAQGYGSSNTLNQKYALTERDKATGLDHTWFRKLENQAGRWTSPDPYNGSMNLGSPQSFNRYSYVGNDPLNFVDPSGLDDEEPIVIIHVSTSRWWEVLWSLWFHSFDRWIPSPTGGDPIDVGGGGGPGAPGNDDKNNSCQRFADEVQKIRNEFPYTTASRFVKKLYDRFANSGTEFSSDGFKEDFQDFGGSDNQARHYVGGLWAGFNLGQTPGLVAANAREVSWGTIQTPAGFLLPVPLPETASQKADKALNAVSTKHGSQLDEQKIKPYELANLILKEVCE